MLTFVMIPVAELARMKPVHTHVLAGLRSFANEAGICWPGLRRLGARCGMSLSAIQRAVTEMATLGYLIREKRGAGFLYRLAARFLRQRTDSGTQRPGIGTEGESKKQEVKDSKKEDGRVRLAPPVTVSESSELAQKPAAKPAEGPNPHARRQWLRRLNTYVSERLCGPQQWAGWEVIAKAESGALDGNEQRLLDGLDRMMRGCGYRAAPVVT